VRVEAWPREPCCVLIRLTSACWNRERTLGDPIWLDTNTLHQALKGDPAINDQLTDLAALDGSCL